MGRRERMKRTTWQKRKEEKWKTHTGQEEEGRRSLEGKSGDADYAGNQEQEPHQVNQTPTIGIRGARRFRPLL
ncbi:hypothetical protein N7513_007672 [Penicillium frequentans]|nr:hypothetical protein N7513_007672 [Penicillium glabrum]